MLLLIDLVGPVGELIDLAGGILLLHSAKKLTGVPDGLRGPASVGLRRGIALLALLGRLIGGPHGVLGLLQTIQRLLQLLGVGVVRRPF